MKLKGINTKSGITLLTVLIALEAFCVRSSPFLPTSRTASTLSFRGGGVFGGNSKAPPISGLFDGIASQFDGLASKLDGKFQKALDTGLPTQLTYGFIAGYCSGFALKRVGQSAALVFGLGFVTLQTLSYNGFIEIRHDKFKSLVEDTLDLNKDGKVDKGDMKKHFDKLMGVLTYNLPSGAAFVGGFMGGVRA